MFLMAPAVASRNGGQRHLMKDGRISVIIGISLANALARAEFIPLSIIVTEVGYVRTPSRAGGLRGLTGR